MLWSVHTPTRRPWDAVIVTLAYHDAGEGPGIVLRGTTDDDLYLYLGLIPGRRAPRPIPGPRGMMMGLRTDRPFFHGTKAGFSRGGFLFPREWHGGTGTTAPVNSGREVSQDAVEWVYVTRDLALAWLYATHASGRGKPKVLVVAPYGTIEPDPEHSVRSDAWRCQSAKVKRVLFRDQVETLLREEYGADFDIDDIGWASEESVGDLARKEAHHAAAG